VLTGLFHLLESLVASLFRTARGRDSHIVVVFVMGIWVARVNPKYI